MIDLLPEDFSVNLQSYFNSLSVLEMIVLQLSCASRHDLCPGSNVGKDDVGLPVIHSFNLFSKLYL